ncbi:His Kinase A (phospho-acceptor) domain-containing protein [Nitrosospira sp. Nsp18]|uniref:sensor histidine kinase n=1 Tax=Nitrosospira sp. Nsp18 TaxID=1855334 RepID=UPI00088832AF|nr:HAMP domain-containing sensor histidine kinase [Nitrosospira sp. Nsp18]SDA20232.1 His Kinase A (phospho-acceptor) domain-containing protein [Nitrosospira sp. Nsp18]
MNDEEPIQNREKLVTLREDTVRFREDAVHLREDAAVSREQIICTANTEREASDGHLVFMREANAQLVISGIEAGRASQLKDEFLAMISHELKTPLSVILGWSQLILGGKLKQDDIRKGMQAIERSARAQNKLIEDLLEMSSMISGKVRLDMQQLDIVSLVSATVESMRPTAETKRIILQETTDREAGWILGDANRMQQVFWNLLSNAIKFTPSGGRIEIGMKQSGSFFEIRIDDSGLGISADFLPYVFERFLQAETSLARQYKGLGLGLAIVKQLVELHGGMVGAESPGINKGASFIVQLPLLP